MTRLNAIVTAYACEPGKGSEPGIGWNIARETAKYHDITVITRPNNRPAIVDALADDPVDGLTFVYYDPPKWATWWKRGTRGLFLYYYWWQYGAYRVAKSLAQQQEFDVAHHVTFGRYWSPSFLYKLGLPTVWGPVGGGESTPKSLMQTLPKSGQFYERVRSLLRGLGELDPFVRAMARKASSVLATTDESKNRLVKLGANNISIVGNAALDETEIDTLNAIPIHQRDVPIFASIGRLLHWKGFHMGLEAFAAANLPGSEYWIVGNGPAEEYLRAKADALGINDSVKFLGKLSRSETLQVLSEIDVLVHPSLHDSGGWVCIESMSAGRPVIALDLGGPGLMVTNETGAKVAPGTRHDVLQDLAAAMIAMRSGADRALLAEAAKVRARSLFTWQNKGLQIAKEYAQVAGGSKGQTEGVQRVLQSQIRSDTPTSSRIDPESEIVHSSLLK